MRISARTFVPGRFGVPALLAIGVAAHLSASARAQIQTPMDATAADSRPLLARMARPAQPPEHVVPVGVLPATTFAGEQRQLSIETRWRPMCGSGPTTVAELKAIADEHALQMQDAASVITVDSNNGMPRTRGAGLDVVFNINTTNMPAGAAAAFTTAETYLEAAFSDPVTVTINVSWANLGGSTIGSTGSFTATGVPYSDVRNGLINGGDADDSIQDFLPPTTMPVRFDAGSSTVTSLSTMSVVVANYKAAVGLVESPSANMTYNSAFSFDFNPADGVSGSQLSLVDTIVHEVGHSMGFVSGGDNEAGGAFYLLDIFRFARVDRGGIGDTNPDSVTEFGTVAREVDFNNPNNDDANTDLISAEHRMSDGDPRQASHFFDQDPPIGIMDPTLSGGQTFFPNYFRTPDFGTFDAIGWDRVTCSLPAFSAQPPASVLPCPGGPLNITASAASGTFQWRKDGVEIAGATSATYNKANAGAGDVGTYDVVLTTACGSVVSNEAVVSLATAVGISAQPTGLTRCVGATAPFSVTASGTGPFTYQWRKDAVNIPGATASTFTVNPVAAASAGAYTVVVSGPCGSITSNAATLTVNTIPTITTEPVGASACTGSSLSLSVAATGTAPLTYQWRKDAVNIPGATGTGLTINPVVAGSAGTYSVVVSNSCGSDTSANAVVTVSTAPAFTTNPSSATRCVGQSVAWSVAVTGSPTPTLQWRRNGVNISGATGTSYSIPAVLAASAGTYDVVATNSCTSTTSNPATLTVNTVPQFTTQPEGVTACEGDPIGFTAAVSGPAATFQWRRNGVNIPGATGSSYNTTASPANAGSYDVVATNTCGSNPSSAAALTVNTGPVITDQPDAATVATGSPASFSVSATSHGLILYQWRRNGVNLANVAPYSGVLTSTLNISAVTAAQVGSYDAILTNSCGSTTSAAAALALGGACPADIASSATVQGPDGGVDVSDLLFFLSAFQAGSPAADLDNDGLDPQQPDGGVDVSDLLFFLSHFEAGC